MNDTSATRRSIEVQISLQDSVNSVQRSCACLESKSLRLQERFRPCVALCDESTGNLSENNTRNGTRRQSDMLSHKFDWAVPYRGAISGYIGFELPLC
jgi:hypothetical protein